MAATKQRRKIEIGKKYARLTIIGVEPDQYGGPMVRVRCDCGTEKVVSLRNITKKAASTKSCGCLRTEKLAEMHKKKRKPPVSKIRAKKCKDENVVYVNTPNGCQGRVVAMDKRTSKIKVNYESGDWFEHSASLVTLDGDLLPLANMKGKLTSE